jgi:hypothetical protein
MQQHNAVRIIILYNFIRNSFNDTITDSDEKSQTSFITIRQKHYHVSYWLTNTVTALTL